MSLGTFPGKQRCPSAPSTYQDTNPASNVPCAVLQYVSGYDSRGKRSPSRANTDPDSRNETASMQRRHLTARTPACPRAHSRACNGALPLNARYQGTKPTLTVPRAMLQHVGGYDSQGKRSRARAGAMVSCRNPWRLRVRVVNWNCGCVNEWRHRHARL